MKNKEYASIFTIKDKIAIKKFLSFKSEILEKILNDDFDDILFVRKTITHSDIPCFAKQTKSKYGQKYNLLYYLTNKEATNLGFNEIVA
ncbi:MULTISPECIES: hypothetical protein [unclassified Campylobacter]|uniref:hypothetical protein n=1 Tax=unclassified Campylobacter TaxID=2593542 RepID=UPI001237DC5E|nr:MULTISPECIES: hypothetical protein [unclassified Campylobacter]KAA6224647.1 hypothetical protein FMM54_07280 [Campylobacter sp. LR185c]KAA6225647.1 hypothetical protein FMM57_07075 [Campylobacter sp. LR286c]KAA6225766.1 hypothetical protein FMM55_05740 [Campylobacter sp. LR196d]KAA6229620.1 hypothetical protein FMM58_06830 [Campylobacter sp. LR291e]KAA6230135.1 hypothetical protein FMM56_06960 [Campylobacter sp. LR264d]